MMNSLDKNLKRAEGREHPWECNVCGRTVGLRIVHWNRDTTPGIDGKTSWRIPRHLAPTGHWCSRGGMDAA